jgi:hypothetical protein
MFKNDELEILKVFAEFAIVKLINYIYMLSGDSWRNNLVISSGCGFLVLTAVSMTRKAKKNEIASIWPVNNYDY